MKAKTKKDHIAIWWSDWLLDAIATATQDRQFLRGDEEENSVATEAILLNARKAIERAIIEYRK